MALNDSITPIILAGGLGTRLRSALPYLPKPLAPVNGRPFISFILAQLEAASFDEVLISTGYLAEKFPLLLGDYFKHMKLRFIVESAQRGTGGALAEIARSVPSRWLLVCKGDSYCDVALNDFIESAVIRENPAAMVLTSVDDVSRYGSVVCDSEGCIRSFEEKRPEGGSGLINAGIYLLDRSLCAMLNQTPPFSLERDVFPTWLHKRMHGYVAGGSRFIDIGTPASLTAAGSILGTERC